MLGLSRKTDYALVALARLMEHAEGCPGDDAISARNIAQTDGLPLPLLMSVLKCLHRAGIITSTRGAHGGYSLTRKPDQLTVAQIVSAIEGPVHLTKCCQDEEVEQNGGCLPCNLEHSCPITGAIRRLNERIMTFLDCVTLDDLIQSNVDVPATLLGVEAASCKEELL